MAWTAGSAKCQHAGNVIEMALASGHTSLEKWHQLFFSKAEVTPPSCTRREKKKKLS